MNVVKHARVTSLPGTAVSGTIYYLLQQGESYGDIYVGDNSQALVPLITEQRIIDAIAAQGGAAGEIEIAADITTRDALTLTRNTIVVVIDASADPTVTSGSAQYLYRSVNDDFIKLSEFESLDLTISWGDISGRPSASPANIDNAVTKANAITSTGSGVIISNIERSSFTGAATRATSADNRSVANAARLTTAESTITSQGTRLNTAETEIDALQATTTSLSGSLGVIDDRADDLEIAVNQLESLTTALEAADEWVSELW